MKRAFVVQVVKCIESSTSKLILYPASPQVKRKILEEEIHCPPEASVLLASYAVHAKVSALPRASAFKSHSFSLHLPHPIMCLYLSFKICTSQFELPLLTHIYFEITALRRC